MEEKLVDKKVKFGYFEIVKEIDSAALNSLILEEERHTENSDKSLIRKLKDIQNDPDTFTNRYNFMPIVNDIHDGKLKPSMQIANKLVELDIASFLPNTPDSKDNDVVFFQITNCRDTNIPYKIKPGKERTEIELDDDEYIGEFMSILFYPRNCSIMVQYNKYALSITQLENYFSLMRIEYLRNQGNHNVLEEIFKISFRPILDKESIEKMKTYNDFNKFDMKCSDISLAALASNEKSVLYHIDELMKEFKGMKLEISLSADMRKKENFTPLDRKCIEDIYDSFKKIKSENKPNITVGYKSNSTGRTEILNWLIPKVESQLTLKIKSYNA